MGSIGVGLLDSLMAGPTLDLAVAECISAGGVFVSGLPAIVHVFASRAPDQLAGAPDGTVGVCLGAALAVAPGAAPRLLDNEKSEGHGRTSR